MDEKINLKYNFYENYQKPEIEQTERILFMSLRTWKFYFKLNTFKFL